MRANPAITRIIGIAATTVILIVVVWTFMQPGAIQSYTIEYESQAGIVTIHDDQGVASGSWTAHFFWTDDDMIDHPVADVAVTLTDGGKTLTMTSSALVNLDNHTYTVSLNDPSGHTYSLSVTNHQYSTMEQIAIGACIACAAMAAVFLIVRRIVRGH